MNDSGWGYAGTRERSCNNIPKYRGNIKISDVRSFDFLSDVETSTYSKLNVTVYRQRKLQCPENTKDNGKGCIVPPKIKTCETVGNPCSVTTGNKTLTETDWNIANSPLKITRYYNSLYSDQDSYQPWTYNYQASLDIGEIQDIYLNTIGQSLEKANTAIVLNRFNGSKAIAQRGFTDTNIAGNGEFFIDRDLSLQLKNIDNTTWQIKNVKTGVIETYQSLEKQTSEPADKDFNFVLTRIDYANGEFITFSYNSNQRLDTATDNNGRQLSYNYQSGLLTSISLPNGKKVSYSYDNLNRLSTVKRVGYGTKTYLYDESDKAPNDNPNLLTGIIDENGKRYANYAYDNKNRGILTEHAGNSQKFTLIHSDGEAKITDEYGNNKTYGSAIVSGTNRVAYERLPSKYTIQKQYDKGGNIISQTKDGLTIKHTYDEKRNLRTSTITAYNTPDSKITLTEWHASLPVKTKVTEGTANGDALNQALREITYTHDNHGNILTSTITDVATGQSRTWEYTYNDYNQKLTATNPQGLTQTWVYDNNDGSNKGNLLSHTNEQGLITVYSDHNSDGKPQTITSPTGQITTLSYDDAGRVTTQTTVIQNPSLDSLAQEKSGWIDFKNKWRKWFNKPLLPNPVKYDIQLTNQTAITSYEYDGVGKLITTTLPDGEVISYEYDDAHRFIGTTDSLGNRIAYTLNSAGDITQTDSYDPQGTLANSSKQVFDTQGRLESTQNNNGQYKSYKYDYYAPSKPNETKDALRRINRSSYNKIGQKLTDTDPTGGKVSYEYDGLGNLIKVTDPKGNATTYSYNAFGELLETNSPDSGLTSYIYSQDGRLVKQTDSVNREQNYQYDDQGRLIEITDANSQLVSSYSYDEVGRVSQHSTADNNTNYVYNSNNQVIEKTQNITANNQTKQQITRYSYTNGGQLKQIRLNSGKLVEYQYDNSNGKLTGILVKHDDNDTQLIDNLQYSPNGITGYNWSQTNQAVSHTYDLDGRLTNTSDNALNRTLNYDVGNRITNIIDSNGNINFNYQHDNLDRLINQSLDNGLSTDNVSYVYDKNSNRTTKTDNGIAKNSPTLATNNQLENVSYDNSGRTLDDGTRQYQYDNAGRIEQITNGTSGGHYWYNALGQRIQKNSNGVTTYYNYNESGQLIGEYDNDGNAIREYVYLGNQPIALMSNEKEGEILQIHTDHLGTPRAVSNASNEILWRMEGDQFGDVQPQVTTIKMPLRHAGQYADDETGLFYTILRPQFLILKPVK